MRHRARRGLIVAVLVTLACGLLYRSTMLPGLDLGDTPSFQTMAASRFVSPRDAYPLYFAFSAPFAWIAGDRAAGLNLASVTAAALACGVVVLVGVELTGAWLPSSVGALMFAGSYTFWGQAVTAEVYALHMLCLATIWLALLGWERRPTSLRLALLFAACAISFGNHLTTVLVLPAALTCLIGRMPGGLRALVQPRIVLMATACALAGAAPYLWNVRTMLLTPDAPTRLADAAGLFWFDVTKADWRDTMVLALPRSMVSARLRMFAFDVYQQFGWLLSLSAVGAVVLAVGAPRRFVPLAIAYVSTTVFALTYSVGDTHVFLLPGHLILAVLAAPGLAWLMRGAARRSDAAAGALGALALLAVAGRVYGEYPALDRSQDVRARGVLDALTGDVHDPRAILVSDLEWQLQNGLNYYAAHMRDDLTFAGVGAVLPYAPALIRDNQAAGREVLLTDSARARLIDAYGPLFKVERDDRVAVPSLQRRSLDIAAGTRYVICFITPTPNMVLDRADADAAVAQLTGGTHQGLPDGNFVAIAGLAGAPPVLVHAAETPFRLRTELDGVSVDVRMESWLPFDTIRRMGFGHVIAERHHALILERGLGLVAVEADGRPSLRAYAAGIYAPQQRFRVRPAP